MFTLKSKTSNVLNMPLYNAKTFGLTKLDSIVNGKQDFKYVQSELIFVCLFRRNIIIKSFKKEFRRKCNIQSHASLFGVDNKYWKLHIWCLNSLFYVDLKTNGMVNMIVEEGGLIV